MSLQQTYALHPLKDEIIRLVDNVLTAPVVSLRQRLYAGIGYQQTLSWWAKPGFYFLNPAAAKPAAQD